MVMTAQASGAPSPYGRAGQGLRQADGGESDLAVHKVVVEKDLVTGMD